MSFAACVSGSAPSRSSPWLGTTQGVFSEKSRSGAGVFTISLQGTLNLSPSVPAADSALSWLSLTLPAPGPAICTLLLEQTSTGLMLISHLPPPFPFPFPLALVCSEHDLQARKQPEGHPEWSFIVGKTWKMRGLCSMHKLVWTPRAKGRGPPGESDSSTPCTPLSGARGCTALVPSNSRATYLQERLSWDLGAGCCQVLITHIVMRWVCFSTLGMFTLKIQLKLFSVLILKADGDPRGERCWAQTWLCNASSCLQPFPSLGPPALEIQADSTHQRAQRS